jgi:hypothetical protein
MSRFAKLACCVSLFAFFTTNLLAQGIFATLTGVVTDPSESVVASAKVTLRDVGSGSTRETTTNGEGYFTFASVPVGTYALTIEAPGFKSHKEDTIRLGGGERRNVNVALAVGGGGETVEVTGMTDFTVTPVDSGEKSYTLSTKELENFSNIGSNAANYISVVPGFSISDGTGNKASYTGQTIGINANGDSGSQSPLNNNFSYNGLKNNSLDIVSDGAHVSDPGCNCDTPVNPNQDFLQEFKVLTSNFSAENQKGPALITSVTKAGGSAFHGGAFFSARNAALNSNDWLNNFNHVPKPGNKYYYPGGYLSGPLYIPGTGFNKSHQKLFFFAGFEYFHQVLDTGLLLAGVPTDGERTGLFSPTEVAKEGAKNAAGNVPQAVSPTTFPGYQIPACTGTPDGTCMDPNMVALMKLYPEPNVDPNSNGGFNFAQAEIFNQNNRQATARVDYNISDNTKVFVRYNYQREVQLFPIGLWWRQTDQVPYPTQIQGKNKSDALTGTITHVFSPTMTNETVMAYTYIGFPNVFADPKAIDRANVGFAYAGLFGNGVKQIPSFGGNGQASEAALVFNPGGFEAGGASAGLYADKWMPSVSDTVTKVVRTHTLKAGFFFEWIRNAQPANNNTNGYMQFVPGDNKNTTGNAFADEITGSISKYNEANFNRINDISYKTVEFFGQDSWKFNRRLTLEFGVRLTHFTPWTDDENFGYGIFDKAAYASAYAADPTCTAGPTFCGFSWHARSSSVPLTGFPTRALYYQPRVGFAYDLFGSGKTVLRGGYGRFYYHSGQFTNGLDASAGAAQANLDPKNWFTPGTTCAGNQSGPLLAANLSCINVAASPANPFAVDSKDDKQPYTDSYSFTIAQRTPFQGLLEVAYVGNKSDDQLNTGGAASNINLVPLGAMLSATDPVTGLANTNPGNATADHWRPLQGYQDLNTATSNIYTNYNALQVTWGRHAGRYTVQANYTLQKSLGIVQPGNPANGPTVTLDVFNLKGNYGVMQNDRRNLFNLVYSVELGNPVRDQKLLGGVANGWQLSGNMQLQSGANLSYLSSNANFGMSVTCVNPANTPTGQDPCLTLQNKNAIVPGSISAANPLGIPINNQSILGTNAQQLQPLVTCNPRSGLASNQFLNGNCFAFPSTPINAGGANGPSLLPVVYGPGYFGWNMALFKNFKISESKNLQFRVQGVNFLNHPLSSFTGSNNLALTFTQDPTDPTNAITLNNANFGKTTTKEGNRIIEMVVKFTF